VRLADVHDDEAHTVSEAAIQFVHSRCGGVGDGTRARSEDQKHRPLAQVAGAQTAAVGRWQIERRHAIARRRIRVQESHVSHHHRQRQVVEAVPVPLSQFGGGARVFELPWRQHLCGSGVHCRSP